MKQRLLQPLAASTPVSPTPTGDRLAAVLIAVLEEEIDSPVLFTRRAHRMRRHAGEVSLPGGLMEDRDQGSVVRTALREAQEELGLQPDSLTVQAVLPPCANSSGVLVYPVLATLRRAGAWRLQCSEVAEVLELPLSIFLNADGYRRETRLYQGHRKETLVLDYQGEEIWGLTARIMDSLRRHLLQNPPAGNTQGQPWPPR